jgi:hypothetical protein
MYLEYYIAESYQSSGNPANVPYLEQVQTNVPFSYYF